MTRDAELTRQRLLEAAAVEFAEHGIAGARVDRIAAAAQCNKAMIYAAFGSKDQLFDAVFTAEVAEPLSRVDYDPADLPRYAGLLFDCFEDRPATLRLYAWYNLERPGGSPMQAIGVRNDDRLARLEKAQTDGIPSTHYSAVELLSLVRSIASSWAQLSHSSLGPQAPADRERRRFIVVDAVRRLIEPREPA
jgi:AcrR family transcriptional regulator